MPKTRSHEDSDTDVECDNVEALKIKLEIIRLQNEEKEKQRRHEKEENEKERENSEREFQRQIELAKQGIIGNISNTNSHQINNQIEITNAKVRCQRIDNNSDAQTILATFERTCRINDIPQDLWPNMLIPALGEKAMKAYTQLLENDAKEYEKIKQAILNAFNLTPQQYRKKFRNTTKRMGESYTQLVWRMKENFHAWLKGSNVTTYDELINLILKEQYENIIPNDLRIWLIDRDAHDINEIAKLSDKYVDTRENKNTRYNESGYKYQYSTRQEFKNDNIIKYQTEQNRQKMENNSRVHQTEKTICLKCKKSGHFARECRTEINAGAFRKNGGQHKVYMISTAKVELPAKYQRTAIVNNQACQSYRDTGSFISLIQRNLVKPEQYTGRYVTVCTFAGEKLDVPICRVEIQREGKIEKIEMAAMEKLPTGIIWGNDHGELLRPETEHMENNLDREIGNKIYASGNHAYVSGAVINGKYGKVLRDTGCSINITNAKFINTEDYTGKTEYVESLLGTRTKLKAATMVISDMDGIRKIDTLVYKDLPYAAIIGNQDGAAMRSIQRCYILTRAKAKEINKEKEQNDVRLNENRENNASKREDSQINTRDRSNAVDDREDIIKNERGKPQNRRIKATAGVQNDTETMPMNMDENEGEEELEILKNIDFGELQALQKEDPNLKGLFQKVTSRDENQTEKNARFILKEETLMREWWSNKQKELFQQIVVPTKLRAPIMKMAHDMALGGHLATKKTREKVMAHFYWPNIFNDIAEFVRACPDCQLTRRPDKYLRNPLHPIPPIGEPFFRVGVDIVGPLRTTEEGNKFILTLNDIATHYPEGTPLKNIETETVVEALIEIFSRVGFPREILSDGGKSFRSQIALGLWKRAGVKTRVITPYRPQSNGQTERMHSPIKHMLRTLALKYESDWDKMLPYALFAYREAINETTGFSPFELLFARQARGPLDILKRAWTNETEEKRPVVVYLQELRQRMMKAAKIAVKNAEEAKKKQKQWYDKNARKRKFEVGQKVVVLKPIRTDSMDVAWTGPYQITKKINDLNYEICIDDEKDIKRVYHINMVKAWKERRNIVAYLGKTIEDESEEELERRMQPPEILERISEPVIGDTLTETQKRQIKRLVSNYKDVLTDRPGRTDLESHDVILTSEKPIALRPYRMPLAARQEVEKQIKEMLELDIIEESRAEYCSPIVLSAKKDGTSRFCVDFRQINKITKKDAYPTPNLEDALTGLGKANYVSKIDLMKAFWQTKLTEKAKDITSFRVQSGLYRFKVMPFGMRNSSATFIRLMDKVLKGTESFTRCYVDDILIFSDDWKNHLEHVDDVLKRLRKAGLTAKPEKSQFGVNKISFLGHEITKDGIHPEQAKIEAIENWQVPKTKKQVRAFLGTASYYRKYIKNFASAAGPLINLTKKDKPNKVKWTPDCEEAFQTLKQRLTKAPVLISPDPEADYFLQTDASNEGLGAVLGQWRNAEEHPIAFISRRLTSAEANYSTVERETLAIIWALEKMRPYVYHRKIYIQTDHNPLTWLWKMQDKNRRILRWAMIIQEYDVEISYKKGTLNSNADGLSRK